MGPIYYPYHRHVTDNVMKRVCSEHLGVLQSMMVSPARHARGIRLKSVTGQMPYYHRVLVDPTFDLQFHLAGYGTNYEEALIRYVGEGIERNSSIVSMYPLEDRIRYASYNEMIQEGRVVPLEYLNLFSDADYQRLGSGKLRTLSKVSSRDTVGWIECPSLFDPDQLVWVPVQMLFVGYKVRTDLGEASFLPGFSTGTAAHTSFSKALLNALLEAIQIDALMIHWYTRTKAPSVTIDNVSLGQLLKDLSEFEVLVTDLSSFAAAKAHVFGTALLNKHDERPLITYGSQADLDPLRAVYRSCMEAAAITFLGVYGPLFSPKEYFPTNRTEKFADLDTNVGFYSSTDDAVAKRAAIHSLVAGHRPISSFSRIESGSVEGDCAAIISELSKVSDCGVFLDVTPPEVRQHGWYVVRVLVPELITMCLPGIPYSCHPRFASFGPIVNDLPHPLP
jgi:thiazole/oxazole-forming peptide maturase SagD family component